MTTNRDLAERNLAAEVRAVESGQHVHQDAEGRFYVLSLSTPGVRHYPTAHATAHGLVVFTCSCPNGDRTKLAGEVGCRHDALLARKLERHGLVTFDGRVWRATDAMERMPSGPPNPEGHQGHLIVGRERPRRPEVTRDTPASWLVD